MSIKIISATQNGLEGLLIEVEVDISKGLPSFSIVGLADTSVKESKERVRSAILNSGYDFPLGRITINLAPADTKKIGSLLDLPIALGILMESNQIEHNKVKDYIIFGELSLSGELKAVKGSIPIIIEGIKKGKNKFIFPYENLEESYYFDEGEYYPFKNLKEVISYVTYKDLLPYRISKDDIERKDILENIDFGEIIGQYSSKRALEISAAGKHNILLYGEPGCGKTMLAKAMVSILPPLSKKELLEIAKIYSASGLMEKSTLITRPFRSPHHTTTKNALIGGGKEVKAGEVTLAHNGVLFLDEVLEFKKDALESLREPLEEKQINIDRISGNYTMPANFLLVGAFNPIEEKDESVLESGLYSRYNAKKYFKKFSTALLDRMDILTFVPRLKYDDIEKREDSYNSKVMKEKVLKARAIQEERFKNTKYKYNSDIKGKDVFDICKMNKGCSDILKHYYNTSSVSMRGYSKVIKLAQTIADIDESKEILEHHIIEAFNYRKNIDGEII
ncbi:ATP-binding protein [Clostridium botulinum]|nr:ATP-binding protein [Clostridium botulinum]NFP01530.1 ATP-binding protein [Clostridium botulinum]